MFYASSLTTLFVFQKMSRHSHLQFIRCLHQVAFQQALHAYQLVGVPVHIKRELDSAAMQLPTQQHEGGTRAQQQQKRR